MYVFPQEAPEDDIAKVLGQPLPGYAETYLQEVFLLGGRIVRYERAMPDPERPPKGGVEFRIPTDRGFTEYEPDEPVPVTIEILSNYRYYVLGTESPRDR